MTFKTIKYLNMEGSNIDGGDSPNLLQLSNGSEISSTDAYKSRVTLPDHQTPVVILINIRSLDTNKTSSLMNEHNYLKRFRQIYEEKGWITVQCTPTEDRIDRGEAAEVASTLFECLQNRSLHSNPIIMHVLGHEALPVHNAFCQFVKDEMDLGNMIPIKGCILDSCPKQPDGVMDNIREFLPMLYDFLILVIYMIRALYPELFSRDLDISSDYEKFCFHSGMWPQLYLYSSMDHIVPHKGVERAVHVQGNTGAPFETKCWSDTEHAHHLFAHEQEYTDLCQQFVQNCLEFY